MKGYAASKKLQAFRSEFAVNVPFFLYAENISHAYG
jgi:hypothetical protein